MYQIPVKGGKGCRESKPRSNDPEATRCGVPTRSYPRYNIDAGVGVATLLTATHGGTEQRV